MILRQLLEMIRFSHTIFALPFAMLSAVMAWSVRKHEAMLEMNYIDILALREKHFLVLPFEHLKILWAGVRWSEIAGILVCMVAARSAAMAFNRLADRKLDAENPRTKLRHIPAGILSVRSVVAFTLMSSILFVAGTLLFLPNWLPIALSLPVLGFLLAYSFTKRFTSLAHFWLGAALMLAPVCAWIALRGEVLLSAPADILPAVLLGAAVLLWVSGFDIIYACQDAAFDTGARLRSIPVGLGIVGALRLAAACHFAMIAFLVALPLACPHLGLGWIFFGGVALVAVLLLVEHSLVRPDDLSRINVAFFHVNAVVSIGLFVVGTVDLLI